MTTESPARPLRVPDRRRRGRRPRGSGSARCDAWSRIYVDAFNLYDGAPPVAQRRNGTYFATYEDVNGDGLLDLVMQFEVPALVANGDLTIARTELVLIGTK